jgi:hypothetical protein
MAITVKTRNFRNFIARFKADLERAIPRALNRSGEKTVETIVDRTQKGKSINGSNFVKYSKKYAKYRKQQGRSTKPDLNFSGRMLSNLGVERAGRNKIKVAFSRKEEQDKAVKNQKTRPFIGVSTGEITSITKAFSKQLERELR